MVGIAEGGRISLYRTLQKQVSDNYPSLKNARNPFKEGKVFLAMFGIGICSLLQVTIGFLEQRAIWFSLVLCFSHSPSLFTAWLFGAKHLHYDWGITKVLCWDTCRGKGLPQDITNGIKGLAKLVLPLAGLVHPVIQSNCSIVQNRPSPFGYIHSTPPHYSRLIQLSLPSTSFNCFYCFLFLINYQIYQHLFIFLWSSGFHKLVP